MKTAKEIKDYLESLTLEEVRQINNQMNASDSDCFPEVLEINYENINYHANGKTPYEIMEHFRGINIRNAYFSIGRTFDSGELKDLLDIEKMAKCLSEYWNIYEDDLTNYDICDFINE